MKIMGVNDGHTITGPGSGAVGRIKESEHTRLVGDDVRRLFAERGHKAINCTVDYAKSTDESLALIIQQANRQDLDWFLSIHFNAAGGRGVEVYTYEGKQYEDAVEVCKAIAALGFVNRGVKEGTGLYVVRKTKAKSMLIEVCFVDSEDADHYLKVGHKAVAKAIVDAMVGYVEAVPVQVPTQNQQPSEQTKTVEGIAYCTVDVLNVRDGASTSFKVSGELNKNEKVTIIEKNNEWRKVRYYNASAKNTLTGWVNANYLNIEKDVEIVNEYSTPSDKYGTITADVLNVRNGRGTTFDVIGQLKQGVKVKLCYLLNGWWSIDYGSNIGFVSAQYIK